MKKQVTVFLLVVSAMLAMVIVLPASAQETPMVDVADQVVLDGTVTIAKAYSEGPGFIVIHRDNGEGAPGPVIGFRSINAGFNYNVQVAIDAGAATPTLFAMLHMDTGEVGTYEFGQVEGADGPVVVDGAVVTPRFNVNVLNVTDQFLDGNSVRVASVTAQERGWIVIHADNDGKPGPVLGQTLFNAGTTENLVVFLNGEPTDVLWPMLHLDTGVSGEYEFGAVEGADPPLKVGDRVAVTPIWTVPHMRVADQIVLYGDAMTMMDTPTLVAQSVLSEGAGWLVVHSDADGSPGPVLGVAPVAAGLNVNVTVDLAVDGLTPVLWPMLHVDTGEAGVYEFGQVEGADGPVRVNDAVLTFPIHAAPSLVMEEQELHESHVHIEQALIDAHGWLVIHSSQDGKPGPVIGTYPLIKGLNTDIEVEVDPAGVGSQVFPMLHYDTGEAGVYEFGQVEGADGPVVVGGNVVVAPLTILGGEAMEPAEESSTAALDGNALVDVRCTVCHSRERIDNASKDAAGWTATVDRMIGYGAQLDPAEREAVIAFLSSN